MAEIGANRLLFGQISVLVLKKKERYGKILQ